MIIMGELQSVQIYLIIVQEINLQMEISNKSLGCEPGVHGIATSKNELIIPGEPGCGWTTQMKSVITNSTGQNMACWVLNATHVHSKAKVRIV
jgi:hypothetical protein